MAALGVALAGALAVAWLGSLPAAPGGGVVVHRELRYAGAVTLDVYAPAVGRGRPVVVLLHGCCGAKDDLAQLALGVATRGAVVFNATWLSLPRGGRFPGVYRQAACAVRTARTTAADYGGDPGRVTLLGWSDGAMLAAVVANAGDDFAGGCGVAGASARPDAVVAVGGFFGWPVGPGGGVPGRYVTTRAVRFFGGPPAAAPAAWSSGNPYAQLGRDPSVEFSLLVADSDPLVGDNRRFLTALGGARHRAALEVVTAADPALLLSPRTGPGRVVVEHVLAVAARGP